MRALTTASGIASLLLALACGRGDETNEGSGTTSEVSTATSVGSGTLTIGETTYEFEVQYCDFASVQGSDASTLIARGETGEGKVFNISVDRGETSESIEFLIIGEEYFSASIMNLGSGWVDSRGPVDEPLVQIEGSKLTASATFVDGTDQVVGDGVFEASCDDA